MRGYVIANRRDANVFLGRDGVRDFPLLFASAAAASEVAKKVAQLPLDWHIVPVHLDFRFGDAVEVVC